MALIAGGGPDGGGAGGDPSASLTLYGWKPSLTSPWWRQQVEAEPGYVHWKAGADQARVDAGTRRRAAIQALARQYGGIPAGYSDTLGDLSPADLAIDAADPMSQLNRLKASYDTQQQQLQTSLAARGALHSGDLVYGQGQLANQYATNLSDAATTFLGAPGQGGFAGALDDYTQAYNDAYSGQQGAIDDATAILEQLYPTEGSDVTANLDPNWQSTYGVPVYTGPDGSLYIVGPDGNLQPYTSPDQGGAAPAPTPTPTPTPPAPTTGPAGPSNISLLPYYYGGGPLGRPQGPGSVVYY